LAGAARGMPAQADDRIIAGLDTIAAPTLVLVGADDTHFLAAADYMARKIPGAARATIRDAGHASNLHQPALFNRAVEDFLAGLPYRVTVGVSVCCGFLQSSVVRASSAAAFAENQQQDSSHSWKSSLSAAHF